MPKAVEQVRAAIVGAGPAGLAAGEVLAGVGVAPVIFEAKPSAARKFLMAGKSGLNLTKDEGLAPFSGAIGCAPLDPILAAFGPAEIRAWAEELGEPLFAGSSGRVFPKAMKGSPLLRKWMARLADGGATLRTRWRWSGWDGEALVFETPEGARHVQADVTVLALGGASWPRLGSDAAWVPWLREGGVAIAPFEAANMGFDCAWSEVFAERFAGDPLKPITLRVGDLAVRGECIVTRTGLEGSAVYAVSRALREALKAGQGGLMADLAPDQTEQDLAGRLDRPRGKTSLTNHLRKAVGLSGVKTGLLREAVHPLPDGPGALATLIKAVPIAVTNPRPIAEAISSAGGVAWASVDRDLMLHARPGTFVAGEMIDWEAPTGGYLLTACIATGRWVGAAAARRLSGSC